MDARSDRPEGSGPGSDETGVDPTGTPAWLSRLRSVDVGQAVVAIAVLAILARLVFLGARTAHYDEGRVAYWIVHTIETGDFAYRHIIHGPVIQHVNHVLVPLLGASDFVVRLPVALVGGLLPLVALLFREHLEDDETVALALFLAFTPVLVYYSRFMRSDVLVAAFMFAAFGTLVRFYDTRRPRYLYAAAALIALGFGSKENAIVYVLTWVGAAALLADQALYRPRDHDSGLGLLSARVRGILSWRPSVGTRGGALGTWTLHVLGVLVVFLGLTVVIYGPRGAGIDGIYYPPPGADHAAMGLWEALGQPTALPGYVGDTLTSTYDEFVTWFGESSEPACNKDNVIDGWLCFLGRYVRVMVFEAGVLTTFAVAGFLYERYGRKLSRNLVMFAAYGGFVSVLGYPLGTDIFGAWIVVHALVPLSIPAAVGVATIYRWGVDAATDRDDVGMVAAAVALAALVVLVGFVNATAVYTNDTADENRLVQYAQPENLDPLIDAMDASTVEGDDASDVLLYYGATGDDRRSNHALVKTDPGWGDGDLLTNPACARWHNSLPLPWYYETTNASVDCAGDLSDLATQTGSDGAGVVITMVSDPTVPVSDLEAAGYTAETYRLRTTDKEMRIFVHERLDVE